VVKKMALNQAEQISSQKRALEERRGDGAAPNRWPSNKTQKENAVAPQPAAPPEVVALPSSGSVGGTHFVRAV
jgi:hypothetical protein